MDRPISSDEIEAELWRICQRLDFQVGEIAKRARAAAQADADHKVGFAKAILRVEGATVGEREAKALIECAESYALHKGADAVLLAAQEAGRSLRSQIEALRSLLATQRAALTYATGEGA